MNIRVLIVEDFPLVRDGIAAALERDPGISVVGVAGDGRGGLQLAHELRPDVMLLDSLWGRADLQGPRFSDKT
jgi:DNA-binding NarL/FixJ family response regulator